MSIIPDVYKRQEQMWAEAMTVYRSGKYKLSFSMEMNRYQILQNKDFYMDLINTAGDDAYELKKSLRNLIHVNK